MKLNELLSGWLSGQVLGTLGDLSINGLALDSRKLTSGNLFIALSGTKQHGMAHLPEAIAKGAVAAVYDSHGLTETTTAEIPLLAIPDLAKHIGGIAARFYGNPSATMAVIGITGTNGKTSCSQFLSQTLTDCGIIGTLGWGSFGHLQKTINTTPDALSLQAMLAALQAQGKQAVAMEVSSHGLAQARVNGIHFKGAVYTNISRDHLDYHGNMDAYLQAKLQLLQKPGLEFVVVNLDDAYCHHVIAAIPAGVTVWGFSRTGHSLNSGETIQAEIMAYQAAGSIIEFNWRNRRQTITVPLYGDFNAENVLAILAVLLALGGGFAESVAKLATLKPVPGRMESFGGNRLPLVFVDYAHTPDALDKVLASTRKHCQQKLWVVFGCGGDRDSGKRPLMRQAAERWADHIVITDDNPRFENSLAIINGILAGNTASNCEVIQDRQEAIEDVIARADRHDCIIIAGKGHEDYQDIKGVQTPFSDRLVVMDALGKRV